MSNKYSWQQVCLHWISAIVIIWSTLSGFYMFFFTPGAEVKEVVGFINVSLTTAFIPFFILRVIFCYLHGRPAINDTQIKTQKIAHIVHMVLYTNIAIVLATGVLMMDRTINVFHLIHIPAPLSNPFYIIFFYKVHIVSCATLALLVLLHILAVIKHQLTGHNIMHRMSLR